MKRGLRFAVLVLPQSCSLDCRLIVLIVGGREDSQAPLPYAKDTEWKRATFARRKAPEKKMSFFFFSPDCTVFVEEKQLTSTLESSELKELSF